MAFTANSIWLKLDFVHIVIMFTAPVWLLTELIISLEHPTVFKMSSGVIFGTTESIQWFCRIFFCFLFIFIFSSFFPSADYYIIRLRKKTQVCKWKVRHRKLLSSSSISPSPPFLLHFISPPPSFATSVMCERSLNGCGDDVVCLQALWVMSESSCIAVNMESDCGQQPQAWDENSSYSISDRCRHNIWHSLYHRGVIYCYLFTFVCVGACMGLRLCWNVLTTCPWLGRAG